MAPVSGDGGPATAAVLRNPNFVTVDGAGTVYFGENWGYRVRKVTRDGTITTVAGTGTAAASPDGAIAGSSPIYDPDGLAFDTSGNLYIVESTLRAISTRGTLTTVVGSNGGFGGDGGQAAAAATSGARGSTLTQRGTSTSLMRAITGFER